MESVVVPHVSGQLSKCFEQHSVRRTEGTLVGDQVPVLTLYFFSFKANPIFSIGQQNLVLQLTEDGPAPGEDNFLQVSPAQSALILEAVDSHPGGADHADGVVALPHTDHQHGAQTQLAGLGLGGHDGLQRNVRGYLANG